MENFQRVKRAGPVADQPSRLRTPPGVGPRCRRLGSQVNATRWENLLALEGRGEASELGGSIIYGVRYVKCMVRYDALKLTEGLVESSLPTNPLKCPNKK